jgi:hypothetical protein
MNGRRAVIGLCMLCALAFSAVAAQGASAAGTTAYTCKKKSVEGGAGFSKEHCKTTDAVTTGAKFEHVAIPVNTTTILSISNKKVGAETLTTAPKFFHTTRAGVAMELEATGVEPETETAEFPNMVFNRISGEEMYIEGEGRIKYTGVTVTKPAGRSCTVTGGTITTKQLIASTKGLTSQLKFEPKAGATGTFATFEVSGCSTSGLNGTYESTGSVKGSVNGATVDFSGTTTTEEKTLKLGGQNAGIEGEITLSGKAAADTAFTPLSVT